MNNFQFKFVGQLSEPWKKKPRGKLIKNANHAEGITLVYLSHYATIHPS